MNSSTPTLNPSLCKWSINQRDLNLWSVSMASPNRRGGIHDLGRHAYTKACPMLACLSGDLTSCSRKNSNWEGSHEVEEERRSFSSLLGYSSHVYNFERRSSLLHKLDVFFRIDLSTIFLTKRHCICLFHWLKNHAAFYEFQTLIVLPFRTLATHTTFQKVLFDFDSLAGQGTLFFFPWTLIYNLYDILPLQQVCAWLESVFNGFR